MSIKKIKEKLSAFEDVKGYLGSGVFTPDGEMLEGTVEVTGLRQEILGSLLNDLLASAMEMTQKAGFGNSDFVQINSDMGIMFAKCINQDGKHFHLTLFLKPDGNVAMGKLILNQVGEKLLEEF